MHSAAAVPVIESAPLVPRMAVVQPQAANAGGATPARRPETTKRTIRRPVCRICLLLLNDDPPAPRRRCARHRGSLPLIADTRLAVDAGVEIWASNEFIGFSASIEVVVSLLAPESVVPRIAIHGVALSTSRHEVGTAS